MIEVLKDEDVINRVGGRFKLTALIQRRVRELMEGRRPLIERLGRSDLEVAIIEIAEGKIDMAWGDEETGKAEEL